MIKIKIQSRLYMTLKIVMIGVIITTFLSLSSTQMAVAGGAREDWSEKYDDIHGAPECWVEGYDDGLDNPFDVNRHKQCEFDVQLSDNELCCNGRPYYEGFMYGCMAVEGNSKEDCERSIE
jgi:hypothetical protein